jgi:hypothetical protein
MKKLILALLFLSSPAQAINFYDCELYLQKSIGNDFKLRFQLFLQQENSYIGLNEFFGEELNLSFRIDYQSNNEEMYQMVIGTSSYSNLNPNNFSFKKWERFKFAAYWLDRGDITVTCNPKTWN